MIYQKSCPIWDRILYLLAFSEQPEQVKKDVHKIEIKGKGGINRHLVKHLRIALKQIVIIFGTFCVIGSNTHEERQTNKAKHSIQTLQMENRRYKLHHKQRN